MKDFFSTPKEDEYLSEFKQKVAQEIQEDIKERERDLERSRNGLIGCVAGIVLAFLVSWFVLLPRFGFDQNKEIPIIRRPILPVKIIPSEPGGMEISNQDKTVYSLVEKNEKLDTKIESLLPPPETPQMPEIVPEDTATDVAEDQDVNTQNLISSVQTTATEHIKIPAKLSVIDVNVVTTNEPLTVKESKEDAQKNNQEKTETPQKEKIVESKPVKSAVALETKPQEEKSDVVADSWSLQLMASTQKTAVEKGYQTLVEKHGALKKLSHRIEAGTDGLHRLKVGSFKAKDEADKICAQIKSEGGTCLVKQN